MRVCKLSGIQTFLFYNTFSEAFVRSNIGLPPNFINISMETQHVPMQLSYIIELRRPGSTETSSYCAYDTHCTIMGKVLYDIKIMLHSEFVGKIFHGMPEVTV